MSNTIRYQHTQVGWLTIGVAVAVNTAVVGGLITGGLVVPALIAFALMAAVLLLFGTLTVRVYADRVQIRMGIGLIRKTTRFDRVQSFRPVRNPWYYGWGIRRIPRGWLYNVSGLDAVELTLTDGRRLRMGTDEPEALARALAPFVGAPTSPPGADALEATATIALIVGVIAAVIALSVAVPIVIHTGEPEASIGNGVFHVRRGWYSARVPLEDIDSARLVAQAPSVSRRVNGFSTRRLRRGSFMTDEYGRAQLFLRQDAPPYLVVRSRAGTVIVNYEQSERTVRLYQDLQRELPAPQ